MAIEEMDLKHLIDKKRKLKEELKKLEEELQWKNVEKHILDTEIKF